MTKRELILSAGLLCLGALAATLWLQLQVPREQIKLQNPAASTTRAMRTSIQEARARTSAPSSATPISSLPASVSAGPTPVSADQIAGIVVPVSAGASDSKPAPRGIQLAQASTIVGSNDLNNDGVITKDEAKKANRSLIRLWDRYDENKDGIIDAREINDVNGTTNGADPAGGLGATIIANNDLDRDGIVTKEEAQTANKSLIGMWDRYDANGDGKLDAAEAARGTGGRGVRPNRR